MRSKVSTSVRDALARWAVPALTGSLVILNALRGEQQRVAEQLPGMWERARCALLLG